MKLIHRLIILLLSINLLAMPLYAAADYVISPLTDSVNSGIINTKMYTDKSLTGIKVNATVINGIAIFSGRVNSKAQLDELTHIAHSVSGIKGVNVSKVQIANTK